MHIQVVYFEIYDLYLDIRMTKIDTKNPKKIAEKSKNPKKIVKIWSDFVQKVVKNGRQKVQMVGGRSDGAGARGFREVGAAKLPLYLYRGINCFWYFKTNLKPQNKPKTRKIIADMDGI